MSKTVSISKFKNNAAISKQHKESKVPATVTKNGYADVVLASIELHEQTIAKKQAALLINESIEDVKNGGKPIDSKIVFDKLRNEF